VTAVGVREAKIREWLKKRDAGGGKVGIFVMVTKRLMLSDCLFDAFADHYSNPQEKRFIYAVSEGLSRQRRMTFAWHPTEARKEHRCVRGCRIQDRHVYYQYETGPGWGDHIKFCLPCVAMVLYFQGVAEDPNYPEWFWDPESERSVRKRSLNPDGIDRLLAKVERMAEEGNNDE